MTGYKLEKGDSIMELYYWILQEDASENYDAVVNLIEQNKWWVDKMGPEGATEQMYEIYKKAQREMGWM